MVVDILRRETGVAVATSQTISNITATTFDIDGSAISTDSDDRVYLSGARSTSDWDQPYEMWGLEATCSQYNPADELAGVGATDEDGFGASPGASGLFGELNRNSLTWWQGSTVDASGAVLDGDLLPLQEAYDEAEIEADGNGDYAGLIITSHAVRRHIAKQTTDLRRWGQQTTIKTGWKGVEFNDAVIYADKWASPCVAPANSSINEYDRAYFLNTDHFEFQIMEELAWEDTGGVLVRAGVGSGAKDEFEAFMKTYMNLCCDRPNASVLCHGIN